MRTNANLTQFNLLELQWSVTVVDFRKLEPRKRSTFFPRTKPDKSQSSKSFDSLTLLRDVSDAALILWKYDLKGTFPSWLIMSTQKNPQPLEEALDLVLQRPEGAGRRSEI